MSDSEEEADLNMNSASNANNANDGSDSEDEGSFDNNSEGEDDGSDDDEMLAELSAASKKRSSVESLDFSEKKKKSKTSSESDSSGDEGGQEEGEEEQIDARGTIFLPRKALLSFCDCNVSIIDAERNSIEITLKTTTPKTTTANQPAEGRTASTLLSGPQKNCRWHSWPAPAEKRLPSLGDFRPHYRPKSTSSTALPSPSPLVVLAGVCLKVGFRANLIPNFA